MHRIVSATLALLILGAPAKGDDPPSPRTVYLVGDSTVKNGSGRGEGKLWGWGNFLVEQFDPAKVQVKNRALGGRSSRTYQTEGLWDKVLADLHPGDVVLIQMGHNDGGPVDTGRARASLRGVGEETRDVVVEATKKPETVHTYGWYLRKYVAEARSKGAIPIILSPVPRGRWTPDGRVARASNDYGKWAGEVARAEGVPFVDLNEIVARHYEELGREKVAAFFTPADLTHTNEAGARLNAASVAEGLRGLKDNPLAGLLKPGPG